MLFLVTKLKVGQDPANRQLVAKASSNAMSKTCELVVYLLLLSACLGIKALKA